MSIRKSIWPALMALCIIGASVYMGSWDIRNEKIHSPVLIGGDEETVSVQGVPADASEDPFDLEDRLVGTKKVEDKGVTYQVETYREFEVYKDQDGTTVKEIPTSNFNYLRYRVKE